MFYLAFGRRRFVVETRIPLYIDHHGSRRSYGYVTGIPVIPRQDSNFTTYAVKRSEGRKITERGHWQMNRSVQATPNVLTCSLTVSKLSLVTRVGPVGM
jgi:hypothetical protein